MSFLQSFFSRFNRKLPSFVCRSEHFETEWYRHWALQIAKGNPDLFLFGEGFASTFRKVWEAMEFEGNAPRYCHRKMWEWCAISQALYERGQLKPGKRGCGFAVGHEPLTSLFASLGAEVLATDLHAGVDESWGGTGQQAGSLKQIHWPNLISEADLNERARFQPVDMRDLSDLPKSSFDFLWSSCSLEHLGALEAGLKFIEDSTKLLKAGGVAVHTTEFNISSRDATLTSGENVIYRQRDLLELQKRLRLHSSTLHQLDFRPGDAEYDRDYDRPPYYQTGRQHIKLELSGYVSSSILLIITKDR